MAQSVKLMRALHAEGKRRGLDHDALHDVCRVRFGVASLAELQPKQIAALLRDWNVRVKTTLPRRGSVRSGRLEMVSPAQMETLERAFALRAWGPETKAAFVRRQLSGREQIRTVADFQRVFRGVQAMNRRDGLEVLATA